MEHLDEDGYPTEEILKVGISFSRSRKMFDNNIERGYNVHSYR
jgi:hypothetical protein